MVEALEHAGVLISPASIDRIIISLSLESQKKIRRLGRTLLTGYAYDNFDTAMGVSVPTVEHGGSILVHMTSATYIKLNDDVKLEDLRCSDYLWQRSQYNEDQVPYLDEHRFESTLDALLALMSSVLQQVHTRSRRRD